MCENMYIFCNKIARKLHIFLVFGCKLFFSFELSIVAKKYKIQKMKNLETLKKFEQKKEQLSNLKGGSIGGALANFAVNVAPYITGAGTYSDTMPNGATCTTTCTSDVRKENYVGYNGSMECEAP